MKVEEMYVEPATRNEEACRLADEIRSRLEGVSRGVVRLSDGTLVAFGHDYPAEVDDVADLRRSGLIMHEEYGFTTAEVGFGIDRTGRTWTLMVQVDGNRELAWGYLWELAWEGGFVLDKESVLAEAARAIMAVTFMDRRGFPGESPNWPRS